MARRRRRDRDSGRTYECRALLALGDDRSRKGRLALGPGADGEPRWHSRRGDTTLDLAGARVRSVTADPDRARDDDVLVRLDLPDGRPAWVLLHEVDAAALIRLLPDSAASPAATPLPELRAVDLVFPAGEPVATALARFAPYALRQVPEHGWEDPDRPAGSGIRASRWQFLLALGLPAAALVIVALLTAPWPYRWYVLRGHPTAVAAGTSTGEEQIDGPGPVPADVTIRFRTMAGADVRADVATNRDLPEGTPVSVRYAVDETGWARLESPGDGLDRGAGLALAGGLLAVGVAVWRVGGILVGNRAVGRALSGRRRPALALLTADPFGEPVLLVCDPVVTPTQVFVVPVQTPLPHGAAAAFGPAAVVAVTTLGQLEDDAPVAVEVGGRRLLPSGPATAAEPELLAGLLDGARGFVRSVEEEDGP